MGKEVNFKNSITNLILSNSKKKNINNLDSVNEFISEIDERIDFLNGVKGKPEQNANYKDRLDNEMSSKIDIIILQHVADSGIRHLKALLDFKAVLIDIEKHELAILQRKKTMTDESAQVKISLIKLLRLLIKSIETNELPTNFMDECKALQMTQIDYINFQKDPLFKDGYNFVFGCDINEQGRLEIIEINGKLLQTGFQIIYKNKFLNFKIKKNLIYIRRILKEYYHNEFVQNINKTIIFNYSNDLSQCYVSKSKMNAKWILNFNILNKANSEIANFESPLMNN